MTSELKISGSSQATPLNPMYRTKARSSQIVYLEVIKRSLKAATAAEQTLRNSSIYKVL